MRAWLNSNWLEFLISALIAVVDIAIITPWILLLVLTMDQDGLSPLVPIGAGVLGLVSFWLARELIERTWDPAAMRMLSLGVWLALMIVWYALVTGSGIAAPLRFIDHLLQFDGAAFGLVFLGGAAWWRGITLSTTEDLFTSDFIRMAVLRTVIAHGVVLLVAWLFWDGTESSILSVATVMVPLGFGACLIAATAVQVRSARQNIATDPDERQPGRGWLGAGAGITAGVMLVATIIAGTAGREIWQVLLWPLIQALRGVGWLLDWVILGIALIGYALVLPFLWLADQLIGEGRQQEEETQDIGGQMDLPDQAAGQVDFIPEPVMQVTQWVVAILIVALVIWFALRQLNRLQQRRRSAEGEVRESMWSRDAVMDELGSMLRGLRRDLWSWRARFDLSRQPEDVRRAYQNVIVHAGRQGIRREDGESASRYSDRVKSTEAGVSDPLDDLTERYLRARYAEQITEEDIRISREDWDAIRQRLRRQQHEGGGE